MNAVTKIFVVLLAVTSLLMSSALVVFVNKVEDFKAGGDKARRDLTSVRQENGSLVRAVEEAHAATVAAAKDAAMREASLTQDINGREAKIQELNTSNAQLQKDAQVAAITLKGMADALAATQQENKGLQESSLATRNRSDELLKQNGELNTQFSVLVNKNSAIEQALRYEQEKTSELEGQVKKMGTGGPAAGVTNTNPINAVVRSVDIIGGKKYATISVGSSDNVQKGMKFNVVNRSTAEYLGTLTVDRVDVNEAIGQVEGSKIDKIQAGNDFEAKTQL